MIYSPTTHKTQSLRLTNVPHVYARRSQSYLFNMFGLWMFGGTLAQVWGRNKFLFFASTGLGAALQLGINYLQISGLVEQLVGAGFSVSDLTKTLVRTIQYRLVK